MTYAGNFEADFADEIGKYIPNLKIFAKSLCRNATEAEDLLQDSLLRAWSASPAAIADTSAAHSSTARSSWASAMTMASRICS